ncbi:trypsin-like serine peptidase [Pseudoduganella sp. R-43]|uniref:trypsin-like serine peptidase n=1 Tax=Pseudoduganella sp. R-43 TaxID=3404063 RepID=UPI003CEBA30D
MWKSQFAALSLALLASDAIAQQLLAKEEILQMKSGTNFTLNNLENGQTQSFKKSQLSGPPHVILQDLEGNVVMESKLSVSPMMKSVLDKLHSRPEIMQVVSPDGIIKLNEQQPRDGLISAFCDQADQTCKDAIKAYGTRAKEYASAISQECKEAKVALAKNDAMTNGDADSIDTNDLALVRTYYEKCTSHVFPSEMRQRIGVIVDLGESLGDGHSGIVINSKTYLPIGMAVQLAPDRIYTARHVIFRWASDDGALQSKRQISSLVFIPMNAPQRVISLMSELGSAEDNRDDGLVAFDQVMLKLQQPYNPGGLWPIVRDERSKVSSEPPEVILAGFHAPFARALAAPSSKPAAIKLADWPQYVRFDSSLSCRIVTKSVDGCMIHACDTIGGVSGSPIFLARLESGRPVVVGVHHGTAFNTQHRACAAGNTGVVFNMGAIPLKTAIQN